MKTNISLVVLAMSLVSCVGNMNGNVAKKAAISIVGSWKLMTGIIIEKGDTILTDYTRDISFIKIINDTHFGFFRHDLKKGTDSTATFGAGGGSYSLKDSIYTEHLEYCSAREWEGNDFEFTVQVRGDTLIQSGIEKIESLGVNRINIEKYIRVKK